MLNSYYVTMPCGTYGHVVQAFSEMGAKMKARNLSDIWANLSEMNVEIA